MKPHYTCPTHKDYKEYQEHLLNYKNWCIVLATFLSIPLCLFCWAVNLNLAWTYYFTGILIASSVVPIALSILWARATATGKAAADLCSRNPPIYIGNNFSCNWAWLLLLRF